MFTNNLNQVCDILARDGQHLTFLDERTILLKVASKQVSYIKLIILFHTLHLAK